MSLINMYNLEQTQKIGVFIMKKCTLCKENKNLDEFYTNHARCKKCHIKKTREYIISNPDIRKKSLDNWKKNHIEKECCICKKLFIPNSKSKVCSLKCRILEGCKKLENGCWEWMRSRQGNYGKVRWKSKTLNAHRASYMSFKGEIPEGKCVCHTCDYPLCVNPSHLWLGTQKENLKDMKSKGREPNQRLENNNGAKYTKEQISKVKELKKKGKTYQEIFKITGVKISSASAIVNEYAWHDINP